MLANDVPFVSLVGRLRLEKQRFPATLLLTIDARSLVFACAMFDDVRKDAALVNRHSTGECFED